ncbi:hypothetical protein DAPPUDRAFT_274783 [Daphnia pulex]|uniref:Uncharacterized protein n=1 Tax=Daphnia pulex TaxID=6669 RepID=E9I4Q5_DAPPU|nr:hypothetical protein DAPPUDRAFT_274783 [Daphnia pulex]|eukprot:EFX61025.1 hypothetical protein DAPPUDRAFT_274783 [Daphnia pulex]
MQIWLLCHQRLRHHGDAMDIWSNKLEVSKDNPILMFVGMWCGRVSGVGPDGWKATDGMAVFYPAI